MGRHSPSAVDNLWRTSIPCACPGARDLTDLLAAAKGARLDRRCS